MKANPYILSFGILMLLIVIFFIGKSFGKNTPPNAIPDQYDLNPDGLGNGKTNQTTFDPKPYTDDLYDSIKGINIIGLRRSEPYINLMSLSNTNFAKVMNDWDYRYYKKLNQTLYSALRDESFGYGDTVADELKQNLLKRMIQLDELRKK